MNGTRTSITGSAGGVDRVVVDAVEREPEAAGLRNVYASGTATHAMTLYRHPSGALVFSRRHRAVRLGHGRHAPTAAEPTMTSRLHAGPTVNLLADMAVQPGSLQSGLVGGHRGRPPSPPVSLTAPANAATVSGSVNVTATAADNVGVAGVQFKLDGANLGVEDTSSPYSVTWSTASTANGTHTLTAVARDAAGNTATAAAVSVTVSNAPLRRPRDSPSTPLHLGIDRPRRRRSRRLPSRPAPGTSCCSRLSPPTTSLPEASE